jgi:hypothetical protein
MALKTFTRDNAQDLKGWMLLQCAKLDNDERGWNAVFMIKREFTHLKDAACGLPVKKNIMLPIGEKRKRDRDDGG